MTNTSVVVSNPMVLQKTGIAQDKTPRICSICRSCTCVRPCSVFLIHNLHETLSPGSCSICQGCRLTRSCTPQDCLCLQHASDRCFGGASESRRAAENMTLYGTDPPAPAPFVRGCRLTRPCRKHDMYEIRLSAPAPSVGAAD